MKYGVYLILHNLKLFDRPWPFKLGLLNKDIRLYNMNHKLVWNILERCIFLMFVVYCNTYVYLIWKNTPICNIYSVFLTVLEKNFVLWYCDDTPIWEHGKVTIQVKRYVCKSRPLYIWKTRNKLQRINFR